MGCLELAFGNLEEAHAALVDFIDVGDFAGLVSKICQLNLVLLEPRRICLRLHQVKLMACKHIQGPDSLFLVFKEILCLGSILERHFLEGLRQQM